MESDDGIKITVLKGDKLFNENTPFIINISSPDPNNISKRCNADLICVIDISSSMRGRKIKQVQESLKILIDLMDNNDRIALIVFDKNATTLFHLQYLTENNKKNLKETIDFIKTNPGTNILSGLTIAVEILKNEKIKKSNESRVSSVILLSDGLDMYHNDIQLANALKNMTKGQDLSFTLHTFGYGNKYDAKIMNKLAALRDGSFYYVKDYNKVSEYFACVLGGCISVISQKSELSVKLLKNECKIVKVFGLENLYQWELKDDIFKTTMLQFMFGKEYSFALEIKVDENNIKIGEDLLDINLEYKKINQDNILNINFKYKYELKSIDYAKANEEYIRCQVYSVLDEVVILKEKGKIIEAKELLNKMKEFLKNNYKGDDKNLLANIEKSYDLFKNDNKLADKSFKFLSSEIRQNLYKKEGSSSNKYNNSIQNYLMNSIKKPIPARSMAIYLNTKFDFNKINCDKK